jgi:tRNA pseudouridine38-40 synthase
VQHIRLDLSYDGRSYFGFQSQLHGNTIQDTLERALQSLLSLPLKLTSASRTDTGVSAEHQVVTFRWEDDNLELENFVSNINSILPSNIRVQRAEWSKPGFHPSFSSHGKIYRYRLWRGECLDPFCLPFVWEQRKIKNSEHLKASLSQFVGLHDFRSFSNMGSLEKNTKKRINEIHVEEQGPLFNIWISGSGFLKQMIRIMVGSAIDESLGRLERSIPTLLSHPNRTLAGRTAPAAPLSLIEIFYEPMPNLADFIREYNSRASVVWPQGT